MMRASSLGRRYFTRQGGPSLSLDFINQIALDPRITFTRASSATRVNASGLVETIASGNPRFDYDPTNIGTPLGLLIEESRTNLALWSDDFTNAAWVKSSVTAAKTATGADGVSNSASTLTATGANGTALQTITSASASRVTSCWIKRRTGSGNIQVTQDNGTTWTTVTVTSSWTRVSIATQTVTNPVVGIRIVTNGDAVDVQFFQCESATFITSAIATTPAQVTRAGDVATMTGTNFSSWYNQAQGTFIWEGDLIALAPSGTTNQTLFYCGDGTANNRITQFRNIGLPLIDNRIIAGGVATNPAGVLTDVTANVAFKSAITYAIGANQANAAKNGVLSLGPTSPAAVPTCDRLNIGNQETNLQQANGHIRKLTYYSTRLGNAQLQALTT